jgi:hypothetical protein
VKAEKQLVALLSMPLSSRDAVTVLSLDQYPPLMGLLSRRTHKDMALKVVQTVLAQVRSMVCKGNSTSPYCKCRLKQQAAHLHLDVFSTVSTCSTVFSMAST